ANLSDKDTAALAANIRRAALATYAPLTNLQGALQSLVAMGMDPRIATGMLRPIGTMATTYKLEAEDAAKASFAAYDNLKVPINQSAQAMETMVAAAKAGKVEVADMAKVFPSLTGSAQTLGMTGIKAVAQLGAALQIAGKTARDADEAGNNVNNLLNKLGDNETLKNFKNFGIDAKAAYAAGTAAGATQLETMIALLEKVKAKGGTVNDIFGDMQARAAAAALLANKAEFNKIATTAGGSKGMIQQDLGKRLANDPLAQQAALMSRLGDAGITIGTHLLPPLTALAEKAAALTERFATFANQNPRLMAMLSNIAVYALAASAGVGTLRLGFGMFSYAAHGVLATRRIGASLFSAMPTIFSTAGMALNTLRTGFTAFRTGMMAARVASMAFAASNPVFLILTGLALLALAAYNHWDKIVVAFNWAKDKIMAIGEWFKNIGAMMIDGLILGFTNTYERVKAKITAVPEKLANLFRNKLGIRSPSRLFAEYGGHLMTGLANGIDGGAGGPLARIGRLSRDMTAALAVGAGLAGPAAAAPPGVAGGAAGGGVVQNITITIVQQPGQSGPDLARMIAAELDKRQRAAGAARRSGFGDYGE
ncbi:MAG: phage tail tape measure protein, partial [Sphingomonadales bacterium]